MLYSTLLSETLSEFACYDAEMLNVYYPLLPVFKASSVQQFEKRYTVPYLNYIDHYECPIPTLTLNN